MSADSSSSSVFSPPLNAVMTGNRQFPPYLLKFNKPKSPRIQRVLIDTNAYKPQEWESSPVSCNTASQELWNQVQIENKALRKRMANMQTMISNLQSDIDSAAFVQKNTSPLSSSIRSLPMKPVSDERLNNEQSDSDQNKKHCCTNCKRSNNRIESLENAINAQKLNLDAVTNDNLKLSQLNQELVSKLTEKQAELDSANKINAELVDRIESMLEKVEFLESELNATVSSKVSLQTQLSAYERILSELETNAEGGGTANVPDNYDSGVTKCLADELEQSGGGDNCTFSTMQKRIDQLEEDNRQLLVYVRNVITKLMECDDVTMKRVLEKP